MRSANVKLIGIFCLLIGSVFGKIIEVPNLTSNEKEMFKGYAFDDWSKEMSKMPFNGECELCKTVDFLKSRYNLSIAIETGAYYGITSKFFTTIFDDVHTIELHQQYIDIAKESYGDIENIHIHHGNSGKKLDGLLRTLKGERIFFYLDAHWGAYWPLRDELTQISRYFKDNCIVMIDDFKIPGYDIHYDKCNGEEYTYENIKRHIDKLFSNYKVYHLITEKHFRGKLLLIPDSYSDGEELTVEQLRDFQCVKK